MIRIFTFTFLLLGTFLTAQTTADFEGITLAPESFLNGENANGGFSDGNIFLPNTFTVFPTFTSWSGWSISNTTDVTTAGYTNQYSAFPGSGADGSANYAVAFGDNVIHLEGMAMGEIVNGFEITNGTYSYISMRDGDGFAKAFGGPTGNDPDFLFVTFKKYLDGELSTDSIDFYLADFRFEDNSMDYIVDEWTYIDLSVLGPADSIAYTFVTSDIGVNGANTPQYFCMDNFQTSDGIVSVNNVENPKSFEIYPNPTADFIIIKKESLEEAALIIYDMYGKLIRSEQINADQQKIELKDLASGTYIIEMKNGDASENQILIKQ